MAEHDHPVDPHRVAAARARLIDAEEAARLTGLLGLLADPVRARSVCSGPSPRLAADGTATRLPGGRSKTVTPANIRAFARLSR